MRRLIYELRTEAEGSARTAVAIGVGVFVGCLPVYGLHLAICWVLGRLLRLNRLKMYLAANISNPFMAPVIVFTELQVGAWIRRQDFHDLTLQAVRSTSPWVFGADVVVGSLVTGILLGTGIGLTTWLTTHSDSRDPVFGAVMRRASDRYVSTSITAWEFARGKMRGDPLYRTVLMAHVLPSGGVLVDVGCGQGLVLALLAEAAIAWREGTWTDPVPPPMFTELLGIETRPRVASIARRALGGDATIVTGDARVHVPANCRVVLFFDVLHMMAKEDQERLLHDMAKALEPGGVMLVREADAAAGLRFRAVRVGNRLKAVVFGHWRQTFHFRTAGEWRSCFARAGFEVHARASGEGTPFGNVLFVLSPRGSGSA
jgi:uncharacterized protein (DUF2062 family)/SAM-dependent methyltransferase